MDCGSFIAMGFQTVPNFVTIRTELESADQRLLADVWMGVMHFSIIEHITFYGYAGHKCYHKVNTKTT